MLFAASGGSGFGQAVSGLQPSEPKATTREGKFLNGRQTADGLKAWVDSLNI